MLEGSPVTKTSSKRNNEKRSSTSKKKKHKSSSSGVLLTTELLERSDLRTGYPFIPHLPINMRSIENNYADQSESLGMIGGREREEYRRPNYIQTGLLQTGPTAQLDNWESSYSNRVCKTSRPQYQSYHPNPLRHYPQKSLEFSGDSGLRTSEVLEKSYLRRPSLLKVDQTSLTEEIRYRAQVEQVGVGWKSLKRKRDSL